VDHEPLVVRFVNVCRNLSIYNGNVYMAILQCTHISSLVKIVNLQLNKNVTIARVEEPISLQSGQFWATSIASLRERLLDFRSYWIVFIHIVRGCPSGLLQFSKRKLLRSYWHPPVEVYYSQHCDIVKSSAFSRLQNNVKVNEDLKTRHIHDHFTRGWGWTSHSTH